MKKLKGKKKIMKISEICVLIVLVYYRITYYNLYDRYIGVNVAKNDILRESKRNMSFNFLNEMLI